MTTPRLPRPWHILGLLALMAGFAFLASLTATLILTFTEPPFHAPVAAPEHAAGAPTESTALSLTVLVAHDRTRQTAQLMQQAAQHRSWTLHGEGNRRTLVLPLQDLPLLREAHTSPEPALEHLATSRPAPPDAPTVTARIEWHLQPSPSTERAAAALTPTFIATLVLGVIYLSGLGRPLLRQRTAPQAEHP